MKNEAGERRESFLQRRLLNLEIFEFMYIYIFFLLQAKYNKSYALFVVYSRPRFFTLTIVFNADPKQTSVTFIAQWTMETSSFFCSL